MKLKFAKRNCILGAALSAALLSTATQAEHVGGPHISVYGTATAEVVPDFMRWRLSVRTEGKTAGQAATAHDQNVAALIAFLRQQEIDEKKIQTSQLRLAEDWEYRNGARIKIGYYAATAISFESPSLENYRALWMGLSQLEAVSVDGTEFDASNRLDIQHKTLNNALRVAKAKAIRLLSALEDDTRIGPVLMIAEDPPRYEDVRLSAAAFAEGKAVGRNESLSPGTITIRMRIKAVFRLIY